MGGKETTSGSNRAQLPIGVLAATLILLFTAHVIPAAAGISAPGWAERFPAHSPEARESPAMAFDSANQEMVLFGGLTEAGVRLGDTWTWDGDDWTLRSPTRSPSARSGARMAFDPVSGQLILVGGMTSEGITGETWTWDGSNWTELSPATPAPAVALPTVATDLTRGNVLLFGGSSEGSARNWTWSWNGSTWTQLFPETSPPARFGASMAFDYSNQTMVLFSGAGNSVSYNDTWTWNGTTWTEEFPTDSPPFIGAGSLAFSPAVQTLIHLGGGPAVPGAKATTWTWYDSNWSQAVTNPSPPARFSAAMQLDEASGSVLLFGGLDAEGAALGDTWTFGLAAPPPTAEITSPVSGGVYEFGETVPVTFGCGAAPHGPQVSTCLGSDGSPSPQGLLDTSKAGRGTYTVIATASDGQTGSASISYEVKAAPPEPVCRKVEGGLRLGTFRLTPPLGDAPPVPGLRIRLRAGENVVARINPGIAFSAGGWTGLVALKSRTVRIDRDRKLRFRIPSRVAKLLRRQTGSVFGNRVTFGMGASVKARGDRSSCFRKKGDRSIRVKITNVSSRVALRRP